MFDQNKSNSIITRFSLFFIENYRTTLLTLLGLILIGTAAYTSFLKREGFPQIDFPGALIVTTYFIEDENAVLEDITVPKEAALKELNFVKSVNSSTSANTSQIFVSFEGDITSEQGLKEVEEKLNALNLPEASITNYISFNAGSISGEEDIILSISNSELSYSELIAFAEALSESITQKPEVSSARVFYPTETRVNPLTGEEAEVLTSFRRVGYSQNDALQFDDAINIGIKKRNADVGSIDLSQAVNLAIAQNLEKSTNPDNFVVTPVFDFAIELQSQINSLETNALMGLIGVVLVVMLLVNFRASLVIALFVPTVIATTFLGLYVAGLTINVISLFSIILVLGLFVDDAIVVVEAVDYHKKQGKRGLDAVKAAIDGIGAADLSGTITTLMVFVPMLAISGVLGEFIRLIPITVIIALSSSIVIALGFMPFLANVLIKSSDHKSKPRLYTRAFSVLGSLVDYLSKLNSKFLNFYLKSMWRVLLVILLSLLVVGFGTSFARNLKFSVFPTPKDADSIIVSLEFDAASIADAVVLTKSFEQEMVDKIGSQVESVGFISGSQNGATMLVRLTEVTQRETTAPQMVETLQSYIDTQSDLAGSVQMVSAGPPSEEFQFRLQMFGTNLENNLELATNIESFIKTLSLPDGVEVEDVVLSDIDVITRKDQRQFIELFVKTNDPGNTGVIAVIQEEIENEFSAQSSALEFDQGFEGENIESFNSAIFASYLALVLIYGLLVFQFKSFSQPLVILLAIPFATAGLFPGLYFTDNALSFFVMIGLLGLIGIAINNSIILIDTINQNLSSGSDLRFAISDAMRMRFRPLVVTTATTLVGLLPLALVDPFWEPIAFTIIFGLISSTILVLTVLPAYVYLVERFRTITKGVFAKVFQQN